MARSIRPGSSRKRTSGSPIDPPPRRAGLEAAAVVNSEKSRYREQRVDGEVAAARFSLRLPNVLREESLVGARGAGAGVGRRNAVLDDLFARLDRLRTRDFDHLRNERHVRRRTAGDGVQHSVTVLDGLILIADVRIEGLWPSPESNRALCRYECKWACGGSD